MVLKTPDMGSCTPKNRCLVGPNQGQAYDPQDPCPPGYVFNELKCDCEPEDCHGCTDQYYIVVQPNLIGYSRGGSCTSPYVQVTTLNTDVYLGPYTCSTQFDLEWVFIENADCGDSGEVNQYILQPVGGGGGFLWTSGSPSVYTNDYWEGDTPTVIFTCQGPQGQ